MKKNFFGTDGVRGYVGKTLTYDFAFKLGQSYGAVISNKKPLGEKHKILIGSDTRESCSLFEKELVDALSYFNFDIISLGVIPTPAVSYITRHLNADGAIKILVSKKRSNFYDS